MSKLLLCITTLVLLATSAFAAEGMWTLDNLPRAALQRDYKFAPDTQWITKVQRASVRFAGGCSGSFVSPEGLVLTNHHCVSGCIQHRSTSDNDLLNDGHASRAASDELQCPGLELNQLVNIVDVSDEIHTASNGFSGTAREDAQRAEINRIERRCGASGGAAVRCDVVTLYGGSRHHLYQYRRFQDVRLVWAPEFEIAFFGGYLDNFHFPRYVLDAAFVRVYDGHEPLSTPNHFKWGQGPIEEDQLLFVTGHPGSTERLSTVAQLETMRDLILVDWLLFYGEMRGMLAQYASLGDEEARVTRSQIVNVENRYKARRGRLRTLQSPALFDFKRRQEQALRDHAAANSELADYVSAWDEIAAAQQVYREIHDRYVMVELAWGFETQLFAHARTLVRGTAEREKANEERLHEYNESAVESLVQSLSAEIPVHRHFEEAKLRWSLTKLRETLGPDDSFVRLVLGHEEPADVAHKLLAQTRLDDPEFRRALWEGGKPMVAESTDPLIELARTIDAKSRAVRDRYEDEVVAIESENQQAIAAVRFDLYEADAYPDATATLRVSYGQVSGWEEYGEQVHPFTTIAGLYERQTGSEPYKLPPRWLERRAQLDANQPMNMTTTHDITAGNSGSPVINRNAELVGLIFDGNIHSLGTSYWYDGSTNRAISVHADFIVEALRNVYDAERILKELNIDSL